ncbi:GNAT family N-acetyltransferase [Bacillus salacetis]|uniref:GNAT family N-acetyltransferase n=1 Tax=Bacillus salacetis TaxID=2315464 RepID=UPI003B9DD7E6
MNIEELRSEKIQQSMLDHFIRFQETKTVLREQNGELQEESDYFIDDWSQERKHEIINHFKEVIAQGGAVIIASGEEKIFGFAVLEAGCFGKTAVYRELSYIHVSSEARGKGIGRHLFKAAKEKARELGTEKIYIGAHPASATQAFYYKMGCTLAKEINQAIYDREPLDIQLEISVMS